MDEQLSGIISIEAKVNPASLTGRPRVGVRERPGGGGGGGGGDPYPKAHVLQEGTHSAAREAGPRGDEPCPSSLQPHLSPYHLQAALQGAAHSL